MNKFDVFTWKRYILYRLKVIKNKNRFGYVFILVFISIFMRFSFFSLPFFFSFDVFIFFAYRRYKTIMSYIAFFLTPSAIYNSTPVLLLIIFNFIACISFTTNLIFITYFIKNMFLETKKSIK